MKEYRVQYDADPLPSLAGRLFDPDSEPFCRRNWARIDRYAWPGDYCPEARACLTWDETDLKALLCAREETISARQTRFNGEVYLDSCLEFFFRPFSEDPRYVNVEINAAGAALIGIGEGRDHRTRLLRCPEAVRIQASDHAGGWWAVACSLPWAWIGELYGRKAEAIAELRGNFYTCDETLHPHFGSWSPIDSPMPDFHRPECFGKLILVREG